MSEMLWIVALIGGLVALDTTAGPQVMLSQPIVACPMLGLLLGDLQTGLLFGTALELIWIGTVPAGASRFFDSNMAAVAAAGAAIWAMQRCDIARPNAVLLSLGVVLPIGLLGSRMTVAVRKLNSHLIQRADRAARSGLSFRVSLYHGCGAGFSFIRGACLSLLGTLGGALFVSALAGFLPSVREERFAIALMSLIGLGGAVGLKLFGTKRLAPWIAFGLSIGMLVRFLG
jgi:mannose/fructose/N-acetylgalactosamine-specific phosphotransferase system component IIC